MKKYYFVFLFVLFISACSNEYESWKQIEIENLGSLKVPQEWIYNQKGNIVYFTDKKISDACEYNTYMVGIVCNQGQRSALYEHIGKKMEFKKLVSSEIFSNSATIGKNEYSINGKAKQKYFLDLYASNNKLYIIVVDDSIDYEIIKKIGKSYKMY